MNAKIIRQIFLDFFSSKGHQIVPSASMVIKDDPTLMFTNAGMNQFKDYFLGNREPKYLRIADTQKCLRVSGKHNDLEEVGQDTYHHTMFEMLGNWSFGDYFKKEAIEWGWELLTEVYKIDKDRLYVTIFEGDDSEGLMKDEESYQYWKKLLPPDRILTGSRKDNFWEMGDTGPCGPCSEIHIDIRDDEERMKVPGHQLVNKGHPHVIEIWNLVFIEFNRLTNGELVSLPSKHVDTGMGFERLCMVLQQKKSNYDTDVFQPILHTISKLAGKSYGTNSKSDIAMRVVADHLRAISFAIADGQVPSNNKAGYVIRRILRRAVRYGYVFLGFREPFIYQLLPVLVDQMGDIFPGLKNQQNLIINVIREEETAFLRTLASGIVRFNAYLEDEYRIPKDRDKLLNNEVRSPDKKPGVSVNCIDGKFAFELYDTYGFPVDLTQLMAREQGWTVDMEGFARGMEEQKARSRQAATVETADWVVVHEENGGQEFTGYDRLTDEVNILRYRKVTSKEGALFQLVLDKTPFYAESGGQVGDRGFLVAGDMKYEILDTVKENDLILHLTPSLPEDVRQPFFASVDGVKRRATANNHSATHLLHSALREILGKHVEQKGSLVDENHLRFDFTHFAKMSKVELEKVEKIVNRKIWDNILIHEERSLPIEKAKEMGAMALFGEKYGDTVRVVVFDKNFSIELCGGTHVPATGQIGLFKILSESAIAAGIRRIEAVTEQKALDFYTNHITTLNEAGELLKNPKDLGRSIRSLVEENQELKKQATQFEKIKLEQLKTDLLSKIEEINGIHFLATKVDLDADNSKNLAFLLQSSIENLFLVLASEIDGKANLTVMISENLVKEKGYHAGNIIRELAKEVQGGGGGQPRIATAGGKDPAGIPSVLERARDFLK
ncbi:MAG: alanine--tRNA ligase [Bacteroidetes bacterium]|nr:alanine--tRNA ligase [Bacteroidota bacterium]